MIMALPRPLEAALQQLERRGREVSGKIEEAAEAVADLDPDDLVDPEVAESADQLAQVARAVTPPRAEPAPRRVTGPQPVPRLRSHG